MEWFVVEWFVEWFVEVECFVEGEMVVGVGWGWRGECGGYGSGMDGVVGKGEGKERG